MIFTVLTLFPGMFHSPLGDSVIKKATDKGLLTFNLINIRDFAEDIHKTCDDAPYGGGPGMVMKIEPIYRTMKYVEETFGTPHYVLLTPQGRTFSGRTAARFSRLGHIGLVCGRYEGVDERILSLVDEEISIGDYVLSGGEIPALVIIEAVARLIPGVVGNEESVSQESHVESLIEYPQYTRPKIFSEMEVPSVLLSGNHEEVRRWRRREAIRKTMLKRPDLMEAFEPNDEDTKLIRQILEEIPG
jgi:tRNA (guanine37-N1)-methyltransferase